MKVSELLTRDTWTQGKFAKDDNDKETTIHDPNACKWCLAGAVFKCYEDPNDVRNKELLSVRLEIFDKIIAKNGSFGISRWNDDSERTWEDVEQLIKELDI